MAGFYEFFLNSMFELMGFSLFSLIFWFYWSHRKILSVAWKLPNVIPAIPIIGHCYVVFRGTEWAMNYVLDSLKKYIISDSCPRTVFWVGPYPMFCLFDPEDIHVVLQHKKSFEKGVEKKFLSAFLKNGVATCSADLWKVTRPQINTMFHQRNLNLLYPSFNDIGRELVNDLSPHVGSGLCDVEPLVQPYILKSTCKLVLGVETEVDTKSKKFLKSMESIIRASEITVERFFNVFAWPDLVFHLIYRSDLKNWSICLEDFIKEAIESSRNRKLVTETATKHGTDLRSSNDEDIKDKRDAADRRIQITMADVYKNIKEILPRFTDVDMYNEVKTMFGAGTETSRVFLSSSVFALATHPDIQEKVYLEIVTVTGAEDCDVTTEHIRAMPYLDQVLKETLRKFSIIPFFSRRVQEDLKLRDWTIPKGSLVAILPTAIHYNPKLYPDPERFDPDRFSPENVVARGNHSNIAFGSGPHNCIGKVFVMMLIKTLLIHLLKKYRFSTTVNMEGQTLSPGFVVGFKHGYKVEVYVR